MVVWRCTASARDADAKRLACPRGGGVRSLALARFAQGTKTESAPVACSMLLLRTCRKKRCQALHPMPRTLRKAFSDRQDARKSRGPRATRRKFNMKTINLIGAAAIAVFTMSAGAFAVNYPMVGGAAMYPSRNII